ncbi:MAG TPA: tannase/feruloyl esterase family alpha/beta hydrolase, partial [Candidatus Acidoferrum sp.]|nr:tannase/feruloyl esterase family alpha/beta hydrolase [Candidatus Acidoferrum sp.]
GKSYALRFAVNLPDSWNGRYLFQGGGGLNGSLGEPLGAVASGSQNGLTRGFAVVSTDSGHQGQVFDGSFLADQEAALNFDFLGNMRVTQATKPLVAEYYKKVIAKSYFVGCSTGGREGMIMAQRFPLLYDGIVSGAPAMRTDLSNLALRWMNVHWNQVAAKGADGKLQPAYSKDEQKIIVDGLLKACDALDGAKDGLIHNVAACKFDARSLACKAGETANCLAPAKAEALAVAVAGPKDSRGVQVYSRFPLDTGIDDSSGFQRGMLNGGSTPPEGVSVATMLTQDVDAEFIAAEADDRRIANSTSVNLTSFSGHGGKQIFYHGMSDPWFSPMDTLAYYDRMAAANGGLQTVDKWSRIFMVPGMGHCQGGEATLDTFDMLSAIVDWVEKDQAPASVTSTGRSMPGVSRPLCPYPQHSQYSGKGDINDAKNFSCQAP